MQTKATIYAFLYDWIKNETGLTVIASPQKAPRPARPYASLRFLFDTERVGASIDQQSVTDHVDSHGAHTYTVATEGMRKSTVDLNIYGPGAVEKMTALRDSLDRPDVIEDFERAEISHLGESPIRDLTMLLETEYEERAQLDIEIAFVTGSEIDVGTIEHVEISGDINGTNVGISV